MGSLDHPSDVVKYITQSDRIMRRPTRDEYVPILNHLLKEYASTIKMACVESVETISTLFDKDEGTQDRFDRFFNFKLPNEGAPPRVRRLRFIRVAHFNRMMTGHREDLSTQYTIIIDRFLRWHILSYKWKHVAYDSTALSMPVFSLLESCTRVTTEDVVSVLEQDLYGKPAQNGILHENVMNLVRVLAQRLSTQEAILLRQSDSLKHDRTMIHRLVDRLQNLEIS